MYRVLDISRYAINYSNDAGYGISNLKLQKILYFIQAYFLMTTSEQCFGEKIEAWNFGPVVPEAYREYVKYGGCNIPRVSSYVEKNPNGFWDSKIKKYSSEVLPHNVKKRIEAVIDKFSEYSATDLVKITQNQLPWMNAYIPNRHNEITPRAIKEYFSS